MTVTVRRRDIELRDLLSVYGDLGVVDGFDDAFMWKTRAEFVAKIGFDHPKLDEWLRQAAGAYYGFKRLATGRVRLKAEIGRLQGLRDQFVAMLPRVNHAREGLERDIADIDMRLSLLSPLRGSHRQSGSGAAVPKLTIVDLWCAYKLATGHDPRLDGRGQDSPFAKFVTEFLHWIGANEREPEALWRDIRHALESED